MEREQNGTSHETTNRFVGLGNGNIAWRSGEPKESREDEDAYVGTWTGIGKECGWGYNKTKHDECPDVQAGSARMSRRSMISLCHVALLWITWIDGTDNVLSINLPATFNNLPVLRHRFAFSQLYDAKRVQLYPSDPTAILLQITSIIIIHERRLWNSEYASNNRLLPCMVSEDR